MAKVWGRLSFPQPQVLYLWKVWTDLSTCVKWFVLRDLQTEKVLIEKQECSSGSFSCLLVMPAPPSTRKVLHRPAEASLSPGEASLSVNTLAERSAKMHI